MQNKRKKRMSVLTVDDDPVMLRFVRDALYTNGYDAFCAADGQECIDFLMRQTFDCVILDFRMPGKDGIDVAASMFQRKDKTPVIVFSSKVQEHEAAAIQGLANVREFLKKPCSEKTLLETVEKVTTKA